MGAIDEGGWQPPADAAGRKDWVRCEELARELPAGWRVHYGLCREEFFDVTVESDDGREAGRLHNVRFGCFQRVAEFLEGAVHTARQEGA